MQRQNTKENIHSPGAEKKNLQSKIEKKSPTSLISLILEPPLPISEPHWLPGKTRRSVTGGLLVTLLFDIAALISYKNFRIMFSTQTLMKSTVTHASFSVKNSFIFPKRFS